MKFLKRGLSKKKDLGLLLQAKVDVNIHDSKGRTFLHDAARHGDSELFTVLLQFKADIKVQDSNRSTLLHEASKYGRLEIVSLLLQAKADMTLTDNSGKTPVDVATEKGDFNFRSFLLEAAKSDTCVREARGNSNATTTQTTALTTTEEQRAGLQDTQETNAALDGWLKTAQEELRAICQMMAAEKVAGEKVAAEEELRAMRQKMEEEKLRHDEDRVAAERKLKAAQDELRAMRQKMQDEQLRHDADRMEAERKLQAAQIPDARALRDLPSDALEMLIRTLKNGVTLAEAENHERSLCRVCLQQPKVVILYPCKHKATCVPCGNRLKECPLCREHIVDRITPFD